MTRLLADVIEMRSLAANDTANSDDGVIPLRFGSVHDRQWNFERAGYADDRDVSIIATRCFQRFHGARNEQVCNFGIKSARHDGKTQPGGRSFSLNFCHVVFSVIR